jgi:phosphoglycerol transferase MdoB-like AlkP superfamily enzyme
MEIFIKLLLWFGILHYFVLEGYREGWYWYYSMLSRNSIQFKEPRGNIHNEFTIQRCIVLIFVYWLLWNQVNWINGLIFMIGLIMSIPLVHNGMYYMTRSYIDKSYDKNIMSQSNTSTAKTTKYFTPKVRLVLFIVGHVIMLVTLIK